MSRSKVCFIFKLSFPRDVRINYFLALFFGLIQGLAFANTLRMFLAADQNFALLMFGFSLGLELGQILIVLMILILSQLVIGFWKTERRHWVIFVSAVVFGLATKMAIERWPVRTFPINEHTLQSSASGESSFRFYVISFFQVRF